LILKASWTRRAPRAVASAPTPDRSITAAASSMGPSAIRAYRDRRRLARDRGLDGRRIRSGQDVLKAMRWAGG